MEIDTPTRHFVRYQLPMIIWAALIFVASSIPASSMPKIGILSYDKLIHGIIFCFFGLLLYRGFERRVTPIKMQWLRMAIVLGIVMIYGALDEFHQSFVPGRNEDFFDFLADTIGGIIAILLLAIFSIRSEYMKKL